MCVREREGGRTDKRLEEGEFTSNTVTMKEIRK